MTCPSQACQTQAKGAAFVGDGDEAEQQLAGGVVQRGGPEPWPRWIVGDLDSSPPGRPLTTTDTDQRTIGYGKPEVGLAHGHGQPDDATVDSSEVGDIVGPS